MSRSVRAHLAFVGVAVLVCLALALAPAEAKKPASFADLPLAQLFGIKGKESGGTCVGCTLIVGIIEQLGEVRNETVTQTVEKVCQLLPAGLLRTTCDETIALYGATIISMLENRYKADDVCLKIGLCWNATCRLFPKSGTFTPPSAAEREKILSTWKTMSLLKMVDMIKLNKNNNDKRDVGESPWQWIVDYITKLVNSHGPWYDLDSDKFGALTQTLRGTFWRGKDCNDFASDIYPGRSKTNRGPEFDHNCNGISGTDPQGRSYEDLYCAGTKQYGLAVLGDSATAHFHIPPEYVTASLIQDNTYHNMLDILMDEFDWPMMSTATGYMNLTWPGTPQGPMTSIYQKMRQRNLCMHRDFQNIGVNGARTGAMADEIMFTLGRNQNTDHPLILNYALIGNDVCNGHYGTGSMTTPPQFYANVMRALNHLDTVLPAGSHVVFTGLVDGRVLYDALANRLHPLGLLHGDVTYSHYYDFMNCLQTSPCFGWMNSNAYWRNATTARAEELNQVYSQIIANHTFKNFDMYYFEPPLKAVIEQWNKAGGETWQLIEPVDGFHPNQLANALFAEYQWGVLVSKFPQLVGDINPNNAQILARFGDQGGY